MVYVEIPPHRAGRHALKKPIHVVLELGPTRWRELVTLDLFAVLVGMLDRLELVVAKITVLPHLRTVSIVEFSIGE